MVFTPGYKLNWEMMIVVMMIVLVLCFSDRKPINLFLYNSCNTFFHINIKYCMLNNLKMTQALLILGFQRSHV